MSEKLTEFLALARKRFDQAASDEKDLRDEAAKDLRFVSGDQWDEKVKADRIKAGRPALTFNRTHTFVQQVSNEARENKPQIKFIPAEDGDKDSAEVYEGLARHIQYDSEAQVAYETAAEYAAGGGFGYFRFLTKYCNEGEDAVKDPAHAFDQDLKVIPVLDPMSVYGILLPSLFGMEPTYGFVIEELPKEEFKAMYPKADASQDWDSAAKCASAWFGTETVKVAEYWYTEETSEVVKQGDKERTVKVSKVKCAKINGAEILEPETEWVGYCIPIIPVLGKQIIVDGKPQLLSVVRFQRDPQRMINYYKTRIAETMATAPISPYIGQEGIFAGHEQEWATANSTLAPYLEYRAFDINGKPAEKPQRQVYEPPIQSLSEAAAQEIDDMKATAGIYDASLGKQSNETSGIALARRQQQSNITNMHFMDNLGRAYNKGGKVIADVIPKIYDAPRMVRILGEDETPKVVKINEQWQQDEYSDPKHYKIGGEGIGKYDVVVTMGRAFSTKRMESFDMMSQVLQGQPGLINVVGDIFFKNSDVAGADQLADRFKKMLPPNLQDDGDGEDQAIQKLQQQNQQLQQQHEQLNAYAQQVEEENKQYKAGIQAKQIDADSREAIEVARLQTQKEIEQMKIEAQFAVAEINTKAQDARERMKLEMDLNAKLSVQEHAQAHEVGMAAAGVGHETAMADKNAEHAQNQQVTQIEADQQAAKEQAKAKVQPK